MVERRGALTVLSHLVLVLDSTTPTFRHQQYPAYKAQRQKAPEDLVAAIPMAMELAQALRIQGLSPRSAVAEGSDTAERQTPVDMMAATQPSMPP